MDTHDIDRYFAELGNEPPKLAVITTLGERREIARHVLLHLLRENERKRVSVPGAEQVAGRGEGDSAS